MSNNNRYILTTGGPNEVNKKVMINRAIDQGGRYYARNSRGAINAAKQNAMRQTIQGGIEPTYNKQNPNNTKSYTGAPGMKTNIPGVRPYVYPCPIAGGLMPHQEAAAILSTRLGNSKTESNPTKREDGYTPTTELLFHSAGSGKTLTMWRIYFWWCVRWWAERPAYSLPVTSALPISAQANVSDTDAPKGLPCIVIFISQAQEVNNMKKELSLFEQIIESQSEGSRHAKYAQIVRNNFLGVLPNTKVVTTFKRSGEDDKPKPQGWTRTEPKEAHIKFTDNGKEYVCASSGKKDMHPMLTGAMPSLVQCMGYDSKETGLLVSLPGGFKGSQAVPMLNLYLEMKAYTYMCYSASGSNEAYADASRLVSESIARGAYYEFLRLFIIQNYAKALRTHRQFQSVASTYSLAQDGDGVEYYVRYGEDVVLDHVQVGDFVRFKVMKRPSDATALFNSTHHKKEGWATEASTYTDHFEDFCKRNVGGVSPLFYVKKVRRVGGKYELGLQSVLIHGIMRAGDDNPCYPTDGRGFLKPSFKLYDVYRFNRPITSLETTRVDEVTMSESQQTCSADGMLTILRHAGASIDRKIDGSKIREQTKKDTDNRLMLWWLACGEGAPPSHPHFKPKTAADTALANHWSWLGLSSGKSSANVPRMPTTLMVGMTAEAAVSVFQRFPKQCMIMIDEVQKYSGDQGQDVKPIKNPFAPQQTIDVKKSTKCLVSGAMASSSPANAPRGSGSPSMAGGGNACDASRPGDCVGIFSSATPFVVDISSNKSQKKVNELEELVRMVGSSKRVSIPQFSASMLGSKEAQAAALNKYRKTVETMLHQSKFLVSFIDLDRDPLVIPTLTKRGRGSEVSVWNVRDVKSRLTARDGGPKDSSPEVRIGHFGPGGAPARGKPTKATQAPTKAPAADNKKRKKGATSPGTTAMNISAKRQGLNFLRAFKF
jgi:hypothetical protein